MTVPERDRRKLRLLVGIASYGEKNLGYLRKIIEVYQDLPYDIDIVVFSEAPKNLGPRVTVVVGLPSRNSWSLPFAHKRYFAENLERYDLFIYSEDDVEVSAKNIQAFLRITEALEPNEIAGYLRYELNPSGTAILTDVHGAFHWRPESVRRRGEYVIAEFTNEHAGFYILTREQLQLVIASGGFLREPYEGRHGLPETAATDPYTSCGLRKVICISALDDFLLHHMSNLYVVRHGALLGAFKTQVQTLMGICNSLHPASTLCVVESKALHRAWSKSYYESPCNEVLNLVPKETKTVLSVGCGWGAVEGALTERGCNVTALPLDSVIGAMAARRGIEVIYGTLDEGMGILMGRKFDCVLMTNLLHLLPNPWPVLEEGTNFVREGGTLVVAGPNFNSIPVLVRRALGSNKYAKLRRFAESGIHAFGLASLTRQIERAGLDRTAVRWFDSTPPRRLIALRRLLGRFTAKDWVIRAERKL